MKLRPVLIGVGLTTLSILMLELSLTRLFSATLYYHLAFLAISIALLGSGASGVFVYLFKDRLPAERTTLWLSVFLILFSVGVLLALTIILTNPLDISDRDNNSQLFSKLLLIYSVTFLPFFFAGCAVTLAIFRFAEHISRVYLYDLAGAALGCVLLIPVINTLGAVNAVILISGLGAAAAAIFAFSSPDTRRFGAVPLAATALITLFLGFNLYSGSVDLAGGKWAASENVIFSKWNSFSRITVTGDLAAREVQLKIDADAATIIVPDAHDTQLHAARAGDISSLAYHLKPGSKAAIIGAGGALDVTTAFVMGASHVTAVEINPIIARDVMLSEPFKSYTGNIYEHPKLDLVVEEGRSFIRRSPDKFDVIQATMVDTWAATAAGAFSLTENNLYTVEAFKDYVSHLSDDGLLTMTRWYFEPPDQMLRLVTISREMMREMGIERPEDHIAIVKLKGEGLSHVPATFVFKKSAFTPADLAIIRSFVADNDLELLYAPDLAEDNAFTLLARTPDPQAVASDFTTNIVATRDNSPFFFNTIKLDNLGQWAAGTIEWRKTNLGTLVLLILIAITTVLVSLFILVPFVAKGRSSVRSPRSTLFLAYFGCLGAAFIIVELAMMQKFILFLGHPVYSLAVCLFSILVFSAIGSRLTALIPQDKLGRVLLIAIAGIAVLTMVSIAVLTPIFYSWISLPVAARIALSVLLIAPIALIMGMPMPIGIRMLRSEDPDVIPWAWGLNGAMSVLGSASTIVIAILAGFNEALMIGAAIYLLAGLLIILAGGRKTLQHVSLH